MNPERYRPLNPNDLRREHQSMIQSDRRYSAPSLNSIQPAKPGSFRPQEPLHQLDEQDEMMAQIAGHIRDLLLRQAEAEFYGNERDHRALEEEKERFFRALQPYFFQEKYQGAIAAALDRVGIKQEELTTWLYRNLEGEQHA